MARPILVALFASLIAGCASSGSGSGSRVEYEWLPTTGDIAGSSDSSHGAHGLSDLTIGPAQASPWGEAVASRCREIEPLMQVAAMTHQIDVGLIAGIIHVESKFRADAVSGAGARGLMQVMPSVARRLGCKDLLDPEANIDCGLTVFKRFMSRYGDEIIYGLSAYNAGYRVPNEAREAHTLPANFSYVDKVLRARASYLRHGCGG